MNCKKVTTELVFLFDDEMGQELRVAFLSHVEHCPHCARKVRITRRFMTVVGMPLMEDWVEPDPSSRP